MEVHIEHQPSTLSDREALGMDTAVNLRPVSFTSVGCLLAEVLVIDNPGWPSDQTGYYS